MIIASSLSNAGYTSLQARSNKSPIHKLLPYPARRTHSQTVVKSQAAPATMEKQETAGTHPTQAAVDACFTNDISPEQVEALPLKVSGAIPTWLHGDYIRNGPGTFKGMDHLFDGYGMLVKFSFENSKVTTQQRFVQSNAYKTFLDRGHKLKYNEFGTARPALESLPVIAAGILGLGQGFTDNATVNVFPSNADGSELLAVTESVKGTYRLDTATLATKHQEKYTDSIKGDLNTAHPKLLPSGESINIVVGFGDGYKVVKQQRESHERQEIAKIPLSQFPAPSWIHDFPITKNYVVVPETPIYFNMLAALTLGKAPYVQFDWKPETRSLLHLVPLNGDKSKIRHVRAPAYFTFHYINAYETEDGSNIHIDFGNFADPEMLNGLKLASVRSNERPVEASPITRLTVPLSGDSEATLSKLMKDDDSYTFSELPRINPHYKGEAYRYGYSVSAKLPVSYGNALSKFDMQEGTSKQWHEAGCIPVEPLMVPAPNAKSEDDGVVLCIVMGADGKSFLLCLDAGSFEELGRAHLPYGIPYGFHASFIPART